MAPAWDERLARDALQVWPVPRRAVREVWDRAAEVAQRELFASPEHVVHGDPNPTTWLVAAGAEEAALVLVDWARVGRADPAVDVVMALPGLPTRGHVVEAVEQYLQSRPDLCHADGDAWARRVVLATLWPAVEFLATATRGALSAESAAGVAFLRESLLGWCDAEASCRSGREGHPG